ncbi:MAG: retroviral-like aspartic protease [Elusimicrobia bacterium]|nr:retroviral-like aspartic protease [Elusimicrobiota bacterium]
MQILTSPLQKVHLEPPAIPAARTILLPYIPVGIVSAATGQIFDCYALIDSGASASLFPADVARAIGIDPVENDAGEPFFGISAQKAMGYPHPVFLKIGGHGFATTIYFSPMSAQETLLLGMRGFFDLFTVKIDTKKERIELGAIGGERDRHKIVTR